MRIQRKHWRGDLIPVMAAAFIAIVGQAIILFNDFGPGDDLQAGGSARMTTAAAVSKAGAIQIPSEPPSGRPTA
jgi:hypothetical protein